MKIACLVFPGTNCDHDVEHAFGTLLKGTVTPVWHRSKDLGNADLVVVPGGFSYGDYLRTGALAKISPVMESVMKFAKAGGKVMGICNGFQILCEAGLLPGVLLTNASLKFASKFIHIKVQSNNNFFTKDMAVGSVIHCPVAHFDGNYFADEKTVEELENNNQVVFSYCNASGKIDAADPQINFNGSIHAIAGISNRDGNVVGFMPHPERAVEEIVSNGWGNTAAPLINALG
jgi:phosphoribosylformylglycinamidine synthase I